jgi:small subunit ribosomal protein S3Ae
MINFINIIIVLNSVKEEIGKRVQKECYKIFPLEDNCMIRKVKILKKPKFDLTKLMELYKDRPEEAKPTATKNAIADE